MRGQAWSLDFVTSVTIFFMILLVLFFVWEYTSYQHTEQMMFNDMEERALGTVDTIIRVQGYPPQWSPSNVEILGLAMEENVLNQTKLIHFVGMDYQEAKRLLGIPGYHFYFRVGHLNGTLAELEGVPLETGLDPTSYTNSTVIVPVERYVLFDHRVARIKFMLWR